jgi:hypothetical protein
MPKGKSFNILILTYYFHPDASPRAFRWWAVARHWASQGHQLKVICRRQPGLAETETREGVEITRVGSLWSQNLRDSSRRSRNATADPVDAGSGKRALIGLLKALYGLTWRKNLLAGFCSGLAAFGQTGAEINHFGKPAGSVDHGISSIHLPPGRFA